MKHLSISEEYIDELIEFVGEAFDEQQMEVRKDAVTLDLHLFQLRN